MMRHLVLLFALLVAVPSYAVPPQPELVNARTLAMGGATRAISEPMAAARLNPAAVGRARGFFFGADYATRRDGAFDALSVTLIDNVTSPIGGAAQFLHLQGDGVERNDLSLSFSVGRRTIWWGFTIRYTQGKEADRSSYEDVVTGDVGILFGLPTGTWLTVVGQDLIETSLDFIDKRLAFAVGQEDLFGWNLAVDLVRNFERDLSSGLDLHLGAEYPIGRWSLRLGQMWRSDTGKDYASVGIGWSTTRFRLAGAVQKARQRSSEYLSAFHAEARF